MMYLQLQNAVLAESAGRTMNGLEFCGNTLKAGNKKKALEAWLQVQAVPKAEAERMYCSLSCLQGRCDPARSAMSSPSAREEL